MPSLEAMYSEQTILVTGACGFIGSAIARALFRFDPRLLILLDRSEYNLYYIQRELTTIPKCPPYSLVLGDICNRPLLSEALERHRPGIIFHSAAFKHVPLLEENPFEAVQNNVGGTLSVVKAAIEHETPKTIVISTDKAANPHSILGASKRVAELISHRWSNAKSQINVIRLSNVLGSPGSVVPLFMQQISQRDPVTVTHPEVSRYFLALADAIELVLTATGIDGNGDIFVPKLGEPVKIVDLARHLIHEAGPDPEQNIPIVFTNLRPGDKLTEEFISTGDSLTATSDPKLWRISGSGIAPDNFDSSLDELMESLSSRDLSTLLEVLCRLVPEYQPSELLLGMLNHTPQ